MSWKEYRVKKSLLVGLLSLLSSFCPVLGQTENFFWVAEGGRVDSLALALSDYYKTSILLAPGVAERTITARFQADSLEEALEALAFLLETSVAKGKGNAWFIGGEGETKLRAFPSYGLTSEELGGLSTDPLLVIRDKVLMLSLIHI